MTTKQVDILNLVLILLSFALAVFIPAELFVLSYAILGPLHYLTEINWLNQRSFFLEKKAWAWILVAFTAIISLPWLYPLLPKGIGEWVYEYNESLILFTLLLAVVLVVMQKMHYRIIGIALAAVLVVLFTLWDQWAVLMWGALIPTLIHVYLFTLIYMIYGTMKVKSGWGIAAIIFMLFIPIILMIGPSNWPQWTFSDHLAQLYLHFNFESVQQASSALFSLSSYKIFLAFAYTYHYLNWFTKTSIIGWHRQLTTKKSILILFLWAAMLAFYFFQFEWAIAMLFFVSLLHVILEFPLNVRSAIGILQLFRK